HIVAQNTNHILLLLGYKHAINPYLLLQTSQSFFHRLLPVGRPGYRGTRPVRSGSPRLRYPDEMVGLRGKHREGFLPISYPQGLSFSAVPEFCPELLPGKPWADPPYLDDDHRR